MCSERVLLKLSEKALLCVNHKPQYSDDHKFILLYLNINLDWSFEIERLWNISMWLIKVLLSFVKTQLRICTAKKVFRVILVYQNGFFFHWLNCISTKLEQVIQITTSRLNYLLIAALVFLLLNWNWLLFRDSCILKN